MLIKKAIIKEHGPHPINHDEFIQKLPIDESRYIFFNFQFKTEDKRKVSKTVFLLWTPEKSPSKNKFLYSSNKSPLLNVFTGIQLEIQADSILDARFDLIQARILSNEK